jgi:hypothetical protein
MSDLISRSDVIQILKECNLDETLFEKDVFDKISNLPTAYDVDKVVEQLEELRDRFDKKDFAIRGVIEKAIKIIKAGGKNDNNL